MVSRALAGSLLAALDGDHSTVAVFNNPIYGTSSFIRRGNGKQAHQAAIQNYNNHKLRMLAWDEHAKSGHWFSLGKMGLNIQAWYLNRLKIGSMLRWNSPLLNFLEIK